MARPVDEISHSPSRAQSWNDCDADVRSWVGSIIDRLCSDLGDNLEAVYLHGSLSMGCYHRPKSDLDLLVVARRSLRPIERQRIGRLLAHCSDSRPTTGDLELSIVTIGELDRGKHPFSYELHYSENWRSAILDGTIDWTTARRDPDLAAHLTVARARGIALIGPRPHTLPAVPFADYVASVENDLAEIVAGDALLTSPYYGVLNACRVLMVRAIGDGCVPSKVEGAEWALDHVDRAHGPIIEQALSCYRSEAPVSAAQRRSHGHPWDNEALAAFRAFVSSIPR